MMTCLVLTGLAYIFNRSKERLDVSVPRKNVVSVSIARSWSILNSPMVTLRTAVILAVVVLSSSAPVDAQSTSASLTGRITDSSKAIVPNAKVIVINTGTRIRYESITNETGSYYVTDLSPGTYRIE